MKTIPPGLWALAVFSGLIQVLCFPFAGPLPLWRAALCWISITPLLGCVLGHDRNGEVIDSFRAAFLGYGCGICFFLGNCDWVFQTMHLYGGLPLPVAGGILVLFSLYLGLYQALFAALLASAHLRFGRQAALMLAPFFWVAVELARARITGFPWDLLGTTQVDHAVLTRLAPWGGTYLLSFVVMAVNVLWLLRIQVRDRPLTRIAIACGGVVVFALYVFALRHLSMEKATPTATATMVQENLSVGVEAQEPGETIAEKLQAFAYLSRHPAPVALNGIPGLGSTRVVPAFNTRDGVDHQPGRYFPADIVVWPESPAHFQTNDPMFEASSADLAKTLNAPLILGSLGVVQDNTLERGGRMYDSAALVAADGTQAGRYDKIHLVPFGEYVPFKKLLFFADRLTAGVGDMDRGVDRSVFRTKTAGAMHGFGVFICYESIFGDEIRQFVLHGADVLVTISDDGWYGESGAAWQHLNMVRMRAIENHRWVLRATNTGITASIDPYGRVVAALPRNIRASVNAPFGFEEGTTFYTRHGDLFAYGCAFVTVAMLGWRRRIRLD